MKKNTLKFARILMLLALCCAFIAESLFLPAATAEAATKNASIAKEMTIPIGKMDSKVCWNINSYDITTAEKLAVQNKVKGATYTFSSSDTKVVTINKDGGYLTGLKAGSATITCTQTYKNKKTTVGKCKVTVKKPTFKINDDTDNVFALGSEKYDLRYYYSGLDPLFHIEYRNPNATYSLTSDSKNFTIKEMKCDSSTAKDASDWDEFVNELKLYIGDRYFYGYQFTAKKAGTYTVTVKETYNKKTVTLGSFKVVIKDPSLTVTEEELALGNYLDINYMVNYKNTDKEYYYSIDGFDETNVENNPLVFHQNGEDYVLYGNKVGTAKVSIREGSEKGKLIGTVTIAVVEVHCQEIVLDESEYETYVGDEYFDIYYYLEPWNTTDEVTITSDNPEVLKVEYNEEDARWSYKALKAGTANVTIQSGDQSAVCVVLVEEEW